MVAAMLSCCPDRFGTHVYGENPVDGVAKVCRLAPMKTPNASTGKKRRLRVTAAGGVALHVYLSRTARENLDTLTDQHGTKTAAVEHALAVASKEAP